LDGGPARRKAPNCTQTQKNAHTLTLNIHALSGIRTYDPSFRASEDSACLRPLGYCDRPEISLLHQIISRGDNQYESRNIFLVLFLQYCFYYVLRYINNNNNNNNLRTLQSMMDLSLCFTVS
jgi:hypothetical protein